MFQERQKPQLFLFSIVDWGIFIQVQLQRQMQLGTSSEASNEHWRNGFCVECDRSAYQCVKVELVPKLMFYVIIKEKLCQSVHTSTCCIFSVCTTLVFPPSSRTKQISPVWDSPFLCSMCDMHRRRDLFIFRGMLNWRCIPLGIWKPLLRLRKSIPSWPEGLFLMGVCFKLQILSTPETSRSRAQISTSPLRVHVASITPSPGAILITCLCSRESFARWGSESWWDCAEVDTGVYGAGNSWFCGVDVHGGVGWSEMGIFGGEVGVRGMGMGFVRVSSEWVERGWMGAHMNANGFPMLFTLMADAATSKNDRKMTRNSYFARNNTELRLCTSSNLQITTMLERCHPCFLHWQPFLNRLWPSPNGGGFEKLQLMCEMFCILTWKVCSS